MVRAGHAIMTNHVIKSLDLSATQYLTYIQRSELEIELRHLINDSINHVYIMKFQLKP